VPFDSFAQNRDATVSNETPITRIKRDADHADPAVQTNGVTGCEGRPGGLASPGGCGGVATRIRTPWGLLGRADSRRGPTPPAPPARPGRTSAKIRVIRAIRV